MCVHVVHVASRNCNKQHFNIKENERDYHFKWGNDKQRQQVSQHWTVVEWITFPNAYSICSHVYIVSSRLQLDNQEQWSFFNQIGQALLYLRSLVAFACALCSHNAKNCFVPKPRLCTFGERKNKLKVAILAKTKELHTCVQLETSFLPQSPPFEIVFGSLGEGCPIPSHWFRIIPIIIAWTMVSFSGLFWWLWWWLLGFGWWRRRRWRWRRRW